MRGDVELGVRVDHGQLAACEAVAKERLAAARDLWLRAAGDGEELLRGRRRPRLSRSAFGGHWTSQRGGLSRRSNGHDQAVESPVSVVPHPTARTGAYCEPRL
jgi:hypothetical protein